MSVSVLQVGANFMFRSKETLGGGEARRPGGLAQRALPAGCSAPQPTPGLL
jgi:hypothetical protein